MLTNPELLRIFSKLMSVCVMFTNCMQVRSLAQRDTGGVPLVSQWIEPFVWFPAAAFHSEHASGASQSGAGNHGRPSHAARAGRGGGEEEVNHKGISHPFCPQMTSYL